MELEKFEAERERGVRSLQGSALVMGGLCLRKQTRMSDTSIDGDWTPLRDSYRRVAVPRACRWTWICNTTDESQYLKTPAHFCQADEFCIHDNVCESLSMQFSQPLLYQCLSLMPLLQAGERSRFGVTILWRFCSHWEHLRKSERSRSRSRSSHVKN